jgi:uncharacterized protein YaaQ
MKMVMAIVPKEEANQIISELVNTGHTATFVESRGGVLRRASEMLFIVVEDEDLEAVLGSLSASCRYEMPVAEASEGLSALKPHTKPGPQIGGAVVFVWNLEQAHRF